MEELQAKYADRDVEFVAMYVREPHAGEVGFREVRDHVDFDDKMERARELERLKDVKITIGVDDMSQAQHVALGNLPNMAYVIDRTGNVAYSNTWQHAEHIDEALAKLVTADDPTRPIFPTVSTKGLSTAI
ncbi:MAG: hypothetical protein R8J94_22235 [Acidimicrobiia bacterium]|nr:hypothetical protein [Acidimicrobiia bacterium]